MLAEHDINTLGQGYELHWFQIKKVIGKGGFGITYLAHDKNLNRPVAIKEFMPEDFASRGSDCTIHPKTSDHQDLYKWGLQRFIVEARILAKFNHPNIIRVLSVFEDNNTAYMVMEYAQGRDLSRLYKSVGKLPQEKLLDIYIPIIDGLALVHNANFIHRDIKPANIYMNNDNVPVLLDFGSARQSVGSKTKTLTNLVTYGYAPYEQYNEGSGKQGPWTDIYALGACLYVGITGRKPMDALGRGSGLLDKGLDPYIPISLLEKGNYSDNFLLAIDNALIFKSEERPQQVLTWASMLLGETQAPPLPVSMRQNLGPGTTAANDDATVLKPRKNSAGSGVSVNTAPTGNSQGLINSRGKRSTYPPQAVSLDYERGVDKAASTHKGSQASILTVAFILGLVILAGVVVVKYGPSKPFSIESYFAGNTTTQTTITTTAKPEKPNSPNNPSTEIKQLLENANQSFVQQNYTRPENNNAYYYYREVLNIDSNNTVAIKGLQKIENQLARAASDALKNKNLAKAKDFLHQLDLVNPDSNAAQPTLNKIAQLNTEQTRLSRLYDKAERLMQKRYYTKPLNNNAYAIYQTILAKQPNSPEAQSGIRTIQEFYIDQFNSNVNDNQLSKANESLATLIDIGVSSSQLKTLQTRLQRAETASKTADNDKPIDKPIPQTQPKVIKAVSMEQLNQLLASFKSAMEKQQFDQLNQISEFIPGRELFIKQLFGQYKTMKVNISNFQFIPKQNKANAKIKLTGLTDLNGNPVEPGAWSRINIAMHRDNEQQLKVFW